MDSLSNSPSSSPILNAYSLNISKVVVSLDTPGSIHVAPNSTEPPTTRLRPREYFNKMYPKGHEDNPYLTFED